MTKYQPFGDFLNRQTVDQLRLSFADIERVVGFSLPPSKNYPAWWSNNPSNSVMTKVWMDAGWRTRDLDVGGEKVTFYRAERKPVRSVKNGVDVGENIQGREVVDLANLAPVARSVLLVLSRRSGRSLPDEATQILNEALAP